MSGAGPAGPAGSGTAANRHCCRRRVLPQCHGPALLPALAALVLLAACAAPVAAQDSVSMAAGSAPNSTAPAETAPAAGSPPVVAAPSTDNSTAAPTTNTTTTPESAPPSPVTSSSPLASPPPAAVPVPLSSPPPMPAPIPYPSPAPAAATPSPAAPLPAAATNTVAPLPSASRNSMGALASTPAPSPSPAAATALSAPAPAPAAATAREDLSLVLRLAGTGLVPWGKAKGDLVLGVLVSELRGAGLTAVNGTDLVLISVSDPKASTGSGRRRRLADTTGGGSSSVAAIPSLYSLTQTVEVQAVVAAPPGSQSAVQVVLVEGSTSGRLAMQLRSLGLAVSQVVPLAVYAGITDPPTNLAPLTATSTPTPVSSPTADSPAAASSSTPSATLVIAICAGVGAGLVFTVGVFVWLRRRKATNTNASGGYAYDKSSAKQSPAPAPRRTNSGNSIDLEGACTPRYRQPATPRRAALKAGSAGAAFHMHAMQAGLPLPREPPAGPQLVPGVHLMPRVPSSTNAGATSQRGPPSSGAGGGGMRANVARTMSTVQDMQDARRTAYLAQQAAEQMAMREYIKSKPPQVMFEDEASAQVAREQLARSHSRAPRHGPQRHPHPSSSHRGGGSLSSRPSSYTTAMSAAGSETSFSFSELSATATEIEPAVGVHPHSHSLHSARSSMGPGSAASGVTGGGGVMLPEALKRAAAKVQPGSPRRSAARAKGPFATKEGDGTAGFQQQQYQQGHGPSRLARTSSAPAEGHAVPAAPHDRSQLTGAWVATGGQLSMRQHAPESDGVHAEAAGGAEAAHL